MIVGVECANHGPPAKELVGCGAGLSLSYACRLCMSGYNKFLIICLICLISCLISCYQGELFTIVVPQPVEMVGRCGGTSVGGTL